MLVYSIGGVKDLHLGQTMDNPYAAELDEGFKTLVQTPETFLKSNFFFKLSILVSKSV
jgi:hypothetical protein